MSRIFAAGLSAGLLLASGASHADAVSDFYKGKQLKLIVGYPAGSGYDVHARLLGRHMARGRPYMTPPGVDPARLKALQAAFMDTMKDPAFLAEAQRETIDVDSMDGAEVLALLEKLYKAPPDVVRAAQDALKVAP